MPSVAAVIGAEIEQELEVERLAQVDLIGIPNTSGLRVDGGRELIDLRLSHQLNHGSRWHLPD